MVYNKCIEKPSQSEKMLNTFKQLLLSHLTSVFNSYQVANKIQEFNYFHECYVLYANILVKKVFCYLVKIWLFRIVIMFLVGNWEI